MIVMIEKGSPFFDIDTAREYFEKNRHNLDDNNGFEYLFANSRFFNIYSRGYVGSVFVYQADDGRYYLGGYATRKRHKEVVEAIRRTSDLFDEVYAQTRHLDAVIALKKAGFKWFSRKEKLLRKTNLKEKKNGSKR